MGSSNGIALRAALGFALVTGVTAAAVVSSAALARRGAEQRERVLGRYADDLEHVLLAQSTAERMVAKSRGYLLEDAPELLAGVKESEEKLDTTLRQLEREGAPLAERALLQDVQGSATRYRRFLDDLLKTSSENEDRRTLAKALRERLLPARQDLDEAIERLVSNKRRQQVEVREEADRLAARAHWTTVVLGLTAFFLSIGLAWSFTRRLSEISRREQESTRRATVASAAKEELLEIVAHDLRSPLTSIVLRAGAITRNSDAPTVRSSATSIQVTCTHMTTLIQSLLDAASLEAGRLGINAGTCLVGEIVSDVVETFAPAAQDGSIRLAQDVSPGDLRAWADRDRLTQILSNLVANALRFTPTGGAITVSAHAHLRAVTFEVRDSGAGISPQDQEHVFERHWRADRRGRGGVGLGLYIARGLVEAQGGRIWVESTLGEGSSFQFAVPTAPPTPAIIKGPQRIAMSDGSLHRDADHAPSSRSNEAQ